MAGKGFSWSLISWSLNWIAKMPLPASPATPFYLAVCLVAAGAMTLCTACSMSEEVKRIEKVKQLENRRASEVLTDLTGQQIFLRSCNTCHPGGRQGMGPALDKVNKQYVDDLSLKSLIRQGKGLMPPQPKEAVNDRELDNLVCYLRALKF